MNPKWFSRIWPDPLQCDCQAKFEQMRHGSDCAVVSTIQCTQDFEILMKTNFSISSGIVSVS